MIERDDVLGLPPSESTASANACFRIPPGPPYKITQEIDDEPLIFLHSRRFGRAYRQSSYVDLSTVQLFLGCRFHCTKERVRIRAVVSTPGRRK